MNDIVEWLRTEPNGNWLFVAVIVIHVARSLLNVSPQDQAKEGSER